MTQLIRCSSILDNLEIKLSKIKIGSKPTDISKTQTTLKDIQNQLKAQLQLLDTLFLNAPNDEIKKRIINEKLRAFTLMTSLEEITDKITTVASRTLSLVKPPSVLPYSLSESPIVGIRNIGNTCYFNAALQLFFSNPHNNRLVLQQLTLREKKDLIQMKNMPRQHRYYNPDIPFLTPEQDLDVRIAMQKLLEETLVNLNNGIPINPENLFNSFLNAGWNHPIGEQLDSGELLQFILQTLQSDLGIQRQHPYGDETQFLDTVNIYCEDGKTTDLKRLLTFAAEYQSVVLEKPRSINIQLIRNKAKEITSIPLEISAKAIFQNIEEDFSMTLSSLILYSGTSTRGHYTALVKLQDGRWAHCNDSWITIYKTFEEASSSLNIPSRVTLLNYILF